MGILCIFVMHTPKGVHLQLTPAPPEIVQYINDRINLELARNPALDISSLPGLTTVYNDERGRLLNALLGNATQAGDDVRAEEALRRFRTFTQQFNDIRGRLEAAINVLNSIQSNPNQPQSVMYNALMLSTELRQSNSIAEARRVLQSYNDFIQNLTPNPVVTPADPISTPLTEEQRQAFEEILRILRQNNMNMNAPVMKSFLQNILQRPTRLRSLATNVSDLLNALFNFAGYLPYLG